MTAIALLRLTADCFLMAFALAFCTYLIAGDQESARVIWAFAACLPPALLALGFVARRRSLPPTQRLLAIVLATPIRLLLTLLIAVLVWCVILSPANASFWIWIIVAYALTLAADVRIMLRVLRQTDSNSAASPPPNQCVDVERGRRQRPSGGLTPLETDSAEHG